MSRARNLALAGLILIAGGCVSITRYTGVSDASAPTAELTVAKGHKSGFGYAGVQIYAVSDDIACTKVGEVARLLWTTAESKTVRAPAGRRIVVLASTTYHYSTGASYNGYGASANGSSKECQGSASFKPEAGHSYLVSQKAPYFGGACTMSVVDKATGRTPAGLMTSDYANCGAYMDVKD